MKNELNDIDLIIKQKLTSSSFAVPENEWNMLSRHLAVKSFFRFNAGQINVFYIGAVAVLMSISGIFYAQNMRLKKNIRKMEQIIQSNYIKHSEIQKEEKFIEDEAEEPKEAEPATLNKSTNAYKTESSKKAAISVSVKTSLTDTSSAINKIESKPIDTLIKKPEKKVVKKKVFIKNNPVIIKDTVVQRKSE
jgi:hypothetical protein